MFSLSVLMYKRDLHKNSCLLFKPSLFTNNFGSSTLLCRYIVKYLFIFSINKKKRIYILLMYFNMFHGKNKDYKVLNDDDTL